MLSFDAPPHAIRLNGDWAVHPVPLEAAGLPEVSSSGWLSVPECANLQPVLYPDRPYWGKHLRAINEQAWIYRKSFVAPGDCFPRARLRFAGVDYFATVWLNGEPVGEHEGSFEPFTLDVTGLLRAGAENTLFVRVSAPWDRPNPRGSYPINHVIRGLVKGQYEHGEGVIPPDVNPIGVWAPVTLLLDHGISLDRARIDPALEETLVLTLTLTNTTGQPWQGRLVLAVAAENHNGPGTTDVLTLAVSPGTQTIACTLRVPEPRLWWPWDHGEPNLYRLEATLEDSAGRVISRLAQTFGIRTVRLERAPDRFTWLINERPVFLRGSSYMPGLYLAEVTAEGVARDVALARAANLNLLRVHVHVSPPAVYEACDRAGMLIWQDFELNWVHDPSPAFEARALRLQRGMIDLLCNHPAIITWTCHNEPTMVFAHRDNYERHPDPALYADAQRHDPTRPVFICSGQMEDDWQRAGDIHTYYGALWSKRYTDVYRHHMRMNTEFGFEAPATLSSLRRYPDAWARLRHLEGQIEALWAYQAALIQFHVEHLRRTRASGSGGYVHFWLADLVPQVGCGVLDSERLPKGGYAALARASAPLQVALEHDGRRVHGLWVFNDTPKAYPGVMVAWQFERADGRLACSGQAQLDVAANGIQRVASDDLTVTPEDCARVTLRLSDTDGQTLAENFYERPLQPLSRPAGYPWKFDPYLGYKVFDRPDAPSLADQSSNAVIRVVPRTLREALAEWALRQRLPLWVLSAAARLARPFVQG